MFEEFGEITSAHVQRDTDNSILKDYGYVSFKESESAASAVEKMNKSKLEEWKTVLANEYGKPLLQQSFDELIPN